MKQPPEPKVLLMERYIEAAMRTVRAWEGLCARCDDEVQQDLELQIDLKCGGEVLGRIRWRWNPGLQKATPVQG